jgi:hypothetical protein
VPTSSPDYETAGFPPEEGFAADRQPPPDDAIENQGCNHIGYNFEAQPDASVTIAIEKSDN